MMNQCITASEVARLEPDITNYHQKVNFLMNRKNNISESGATISWVDRETLRYSINGCSVLVWVDYEPGFFNSGRIIKSRSLVRWDEKPDHECELINEDQKQKIINEIKQYYRAQKKACRAETG